MNAKLKLYLPLALLPVWVILYIYLDPLARFLTFGLIGMTPGEHLSEAVFFFIFEVPKVMLLLILIVFVIGIIRTWLGPGRIRKILGKKNLFAGNITAASIGIITPFCTCSAIPLFIGFMQSGIPVGVTFSFLIAAPMINEVAIVLLLGLFGWKITLLYIVTGFVIAITAGYALGLINTDKYIEDWVKNIQAAGEVPEEQKPDLYARIDEGYTAVREIVGKVWIYILLGIAAGAGIHGFVPENFMAGLMGESAWWAVPAAILVGIPMYSNAAGIIPVVQALLAKGAALGAVLAFMMSVIGLSLPETIILRKVIKLPLIFYFVGVVGLGIIIVGYLFNFLF